MLPGHDGQGALEVAEEAGDLGQRVGLVGECDAGVAVTGHEDDGRPVAGQAPVEVHLPGRAERPAQPVDHGVTGRGPRPAGLAEEHCVAEQVLGEGQEITRAGPQASAGPPSPWISLDGQRRLAVPSGDRRGGGPEPRLGEPPRLEQRPRESVLVAGPGDGGQDGADQEVVAVVVGPPFARRPLAARLGNQAGGVLESAGALAQRGHSGTVHRLPQASDLPEQLFHGDRRIGPPAGRQRRQQFDGRCGQRDRPFGQGKDGGRGGERLGERGDPVARRLRGGDLPATGDGARPVL